MQNSAGFRKHMGKPKKGFVSYELITIIKWSHFDVVIKKKYLLSFVSSSLLFRGKV